MGLDFEVEPVSSGNLSNCSDDGAFYLAGDVGGTKSFLGLYHSKNLNDPVFAARYSDIQTENYCDVLDHFFDINSSVVSSIKIERAVLAPAGPINDGVCKLTNANYTLDPQVLANRYKFGFGLINDFEAIGYAVSKFMRDISMVNIINDDDPLGVNNKSIAVFGPGTGFGNTGLLYDSSKGLYIPFKSEKGHEDLIVDINSDLDVSYYRWLSKRYYDGGKVHMEGLLGGLGLERLTEFFFKDAKNNSEVQGYNECEPSERNAYVSKMSQNSDSKSAEVIDFFYSKLGACAHNWAVTSNARGGLVIAGGMIAKDLVYPSNNMNLIVKEAIIGGFLGYPTQLEWYPKIPIKAITDEQIGMKGALAAAITPEFIENIEFFSPA